MPPPQAPDAKAWRVRPSRLAAILAAVVAASGTFALGQFVVKMRGRQRLLSEARALAEAKDKGKDGQALMFLRDYLASRPDDLEALGLRSKILLGAAQTPEDLGEVIRADEAILRAETEPDGERARATRRRLAEAHLARGPYLPRQEQQYVAAGKLLEEVERLLKAPDPAILRLHAQVAERLGAQGDAAMSRKAVDLYERAQKLDPKDVAGAQRLALAYFVLLRDRDRASATLEALVAAAPAVPAFLALAEYRGLSAQEHQSSGRPAEAAAELAAADRALARALEAAPKDPRVLMAAAQAALARKQPGLARARLEAVPEADRRDYRYRMALGMVELQENRADEAIASWSRGLVDTGGSDRDLSWRLAYILLMLGRVDEAEPLIAQYRRLAGGREPTPEARYLQALRLLKLNRPVDAIAELEKARLKVSGGLRPQYFFLLGQCRQATRDLEGAMADYGESVDADPRLVPARLARARLLEGVDPEKAAAELARGVAAAGDDPALVGERARMEARRQARLPRNRRSYAELDAMLQKGRKAAPNAPGLALALADRLMAQGKPEEASELLAAASALDKADVSLWAARVEKLAARNRGDEALAVLEKAAEAAGDQATLRILRARLLTALGRGNEAREGLVRDEDRVRPDQRPLLWEELGKLYDVQRDPQSARAAYARWAELLPDDPLPWLQLLELSLGAATEASKATADEALAALRRIGGFYQTVGEAVVALRDPAPRAGAAATPEAAPDRAARLAKAEALVAQLETKSPNSRFPHLLRASLMEKKGDLPAAAAALEKALPTEGGATFALPRLNRIYAELRRDDDLKRLRGAYPALGRFQAELFLAAGEKRRAEELARQIAAIDPENLDVRVWEATILNTLGKPEEAENTLKNLIDLDPTKLGPWRALMFFQVSRNLKAKAAETVASMIAQCKGVDRPELAWAQSWRVVGERDKAAAAYDQALARWPGEPRVVRDAADFFESAGKSDRAEALLREALGRDPGRERWAARSLALLLAGRRQDAAWKEAWGLVAAPPRGADSAEERLARAIVLAAHNDPGKQKMSADLLRGLLTDLPADLPMAATARGYLARNLLRAGDPAAAAAVAAVDAARPNAGQAALSLHATCLLAAGQVDAAARAVDRLAAMAPDDLNTVVLRARALKLQGKAADSAKLLFDAAAARLEGPDGEAAGRYIVRTLLEELKDLDSAEAVAALLARKYPKSVGVRAVVLARQNKPREAMALYLDAVQKADPPGMVEALRNAIGVLNLNRDDATLAMAEQLVEAARRRDPRSADVTYLAGAIRHFQGRYDDEIRLYEDALVARPGDTSFLNNMAWTLSVSLNDPARGLEKINQAIGRTPLAGPQFFDTRGVALTKLNKLPEAIGDLRKAARERPTGMVYAHLARALHKARMFPEFREARDLAKKAGLTAADKIDKDEREELAPILFGPEP